MSKDKINAAAIKIARKKLKLKERGIRASPEVEDRKSKWSPGLMKNISEVTVRAAKASLVVRVDEETGEPVSWRYPGKAIGSRTVNLTKEEALALAKSELDIPEDAELDVVELIDRGKTGLTYTIKWRHVIDGITVEGDWIVVKINPETKDVISVSKNWSVVQ